MNMRDFKNHLIVFKNTDGQVIIITPDFTNPQILSSSLEEAVDHYSKQYTFINLKNLAYRVVHHDNFPLLPNGEHDKSFRNAWTDDNPTETIDVDMVKAIEIHKNKLRELRKPKLESLDIQYQIADEENNAETKKEIASKKQELRDVTNQKWPSTPEELKNFIPDILK
jgi:hypothetical protein